MSSSVVPEVLLVFVLLGPLFPFVSLLEIRVSSSFVVSSSSVVLSAGHVSRVASVLVANVVLSPVHLSILLFLLFQLVLLNVFFELFFIEEFVLWKRSHVAVALVQLLSVERHSGNQGGYLSIDDHFFKAFFERFVFICEFSGLDAVGGMQSFDSLPQKLDHLDDLGNGLAGAQDEDFWSVVEKKLSSIGCIVELSPRGLNSNLIFFARLLLFGHGLIFVNG